MADDSNCLKILLLIYKELKGLDGSYIFIGGKAAKPQVCFYLFLFHSFFILPLKSMAAHRTVQSKVVKSGTLVEGRAKRSCREFDTD